MFLQQGNEQCAQFSTSETVDKDYTRRDPSNTTFVRAARAVSESVDVSRQPIGVVKGQGPTLPRPSVCFLPSSMMP